MLSTFFSCGVPQRNRTSFNPPSFHNGLIYLPISEQPTGQESNLRPPENITGALPLSYLSEENPANRDSSAFSAQSVGRESHPTHANSRSPQQAEPEGKALAAVVFGLKTAARCFAP